MASPFQNMVQEFHEAFDIKIGDGPCLPDKKTQVLRLSLIEEELKELRAAFDEGDLVEVADAIADLLYVTYGTAVSCGNNMEPIFHEVHRSNMSKVGGHKREDGKWVKPDTYSPARIDVLLAEQGARGQAN